MRYIKKLPLLFIVAISTSLFGQTKKFNLATLSGEKKIRVVNRSLEAIPSSKSIRLDERSGQGLAWIKDLTLATGTIEIDLKGKDVLQKSFIGIAFHGQNDSTFEAIYFRPFNFHAKDSIRKIHAVQYVCHPKFPWYELREKRNGEFEKQIDNAPDPNGWFHAKIVIDADKVTVFVDHKPTASLIVPRLSTDNSGGIALWTGEGSGGEFSNLSITE